jgi:hypothetical protein
MGRIRVIKSSGNFFAGLGVHPPDERLAKGRLALAIGRIAAQRRLTQQGRAG